MPHYQEDTLFEPWLCSFCHESFKFEEDAVHHEGHYCEKSPDVRDKWDKSPLNPVNQQCPTCARTESFLSENGCYTPGLADTSCPQRQRHERERTFPCAAYARCTNVVGYQFDTREFTEISLRYLRSFGFVAKQVHNG